MLTSIVREAFIIEKDSRIKAMDEIQAISDFDQMTVKFIAEQLKENKITEEQRDILLSNHNATMKQRMKVINEFSFDFGSIIKNGEIRLIDKKFYVSYWNIDERENHENNYITIHAILSNQERLQISREMMRSMFQVEFNMYDSKEGMYKGVGSLVGFGGDGIEITNLTKFSHEPFDSDLKTVVTSHLELDAQSDIDLTSELDAIIENAREAVKNLDFYRALDFYESALNEDAFNWEATLFVGYLKFMNSKSSDTYLGGHYFCGTIVRSIRHVKYISKNMSAIIVQNYGR